MTPPDWVLTLAFWSHMLATVVWIGGLAALALLVIPIGVRTLSPGDYAALLDRIQRRLDPLAWFSLIVLASTGLIQMAANPNYEGLLTLGNRWALAIFLKHLVFFAMVGVNAYLTWGVFPKLRRAALRRARGRSVPAPEALHRREAALVRLNLALGLIALALTALARVS